jgi:TonB-dependent Receptor Plug Domain
MFRALLVVMYATGMAGYATAQNDTQSSDQSNGSTVVYDKEFFARFPNLVTVEDLIRRIPGAQQFIARRSRGGGGQRRGFSSNNDRILINGRRVSGKGNDSASALARIAVDQVVRIELIRGGSPDIRVSSQAALLNIVLRDDVSSGSGSWRFGGLVSEGLRYEPGGLLSYGSSVGIVDFFVSAEARPDQRLMRNIENIFDGDGTLLQQIRESIRRDQNDVRISGNVSINLANGDQVRLNGLFFEDGERRQQSGINLFPDAAGDLVANGTSFRLEDKDSPQWEVGGDYDTRISEGWKFKVIGLYASRTNDQFRGEDFDITGIEPQDDVRSDEGSLSTEAIGRLSFTWDGFDNHEIELGGEFALNTETSSLQKFALENGILAEQNVIGANTRVRETRIENFAIHSWTVSDRLNIESAVFTEYSKIDQSGDVTNNRTLFFVRPSIDVRFDLSATEQFQVSIRRQIGQLNFGDFAATVTADDQVILGNQNLEPWKNWQFEGSFEQRFNNDAGSAKLTLTADLTEDALERFEISPGVSGVGNVGDAKRYTAGFKGSYRLDAMGLVGAVVEADITYVRGRLTDAFTGERRQPDWVSRLGMQLSYRHDVASLKFSYGVRLFHRARTRFHDINEFWLANAPRNFVTVFAEKAIYDGILLKVEFDNLADNDFGRERFLFGAGRAGGVLTGRELRDTRIGRRLRFSIRGTF